MTSVHYMAQDLADIGIEIKTDKYKDIVFRLTDDQYGALKESIAENGLYHPVVINTNGDILDGHHRYKACTELGIPPEFEVKIFDHDVEERIFVKAANLSRRHMSNIQRAELALALKPDYAEKAKLNMSTGAKEKSKVSRNQETLHVDKKLAEMSNMSKDTFYKAERLLEAEQENPKEYSKLVDAVRTEKMTINKAFTKVKKAQAHAKKKAELAKDAEKLSLVLPDKVTLLNLDSMNPELAEIPDSSVDLIITDPPYTADMLHLFEGLAAFAARKLKPGGSIVFYFGQFQLPQVIRVFAKHEDTLNYAWQFAVKHTGQIARFHSLGVWPKWKPMLWYVKGEESRLTSYHHSDMSDFIESQPPEKDKHPWAQSQAEALCIIENLTLDENALVVGPFLGSGAFGIAAAKLGRFFVGMEVDRDAFEKAKLNIAQELQQPQHQQNHQMTTRPPEKL